MNIVIFNRKLLKFNSGVSEANYQTAKILSKKHNVFLVCFDSEKEYKYDLTEIKVIFIKDIFNELPHILIKNKIDIICTSDYYDLNTCLKIKSKFQLPVKNIFSFHVTPSYFNKKVLKDTLERCEMIHVLTPETKSMLLKTTKAKENKIFVVPNIVTGDKKENSTKGKEISILHSGRIHASHKNNLECLQIINKIKKLKFKLNMYLIPYVDKDKPNYFNEIKNYIFRKKLDKIVHFPDLYTEKNKKEILEKHFILLETSIFEGQSIARMEAVLLGRVIPFMHRSLRYSCYSSKGIIFYKNRRDAASQIKKMIENPEFRKQKLDMLDSLINEYPTVSEISTMWEKIIKETQKENLLQVEGSFVVKKSQFMKFLICYRTTFFDRNPLKFLEAFFKYFYNFWKIV